jgi:ligand-binding SRPBCC domain-containing protein
VPVIKLETFIAAPPERCFVLARDVEAHVGSTSRTRERAVAGVTTGQLGPGDEVTWEAVHLGVRQRLTSRMTLFDRPRVFEDQMARGAFRSFTHRHEFRPVDGGTLMVDIFDYASPFGLIGVLADKLFLERYMRRLLLDRAAYLKRAAEAG